MDEWVVVLVEVEEVENVISDVFVVEFDELKDERYEFLSDEK